jgi:hypothetical protein
MTTMRSGLKMALSTVALAWPLLGAAEPAPLRPGLWEMSMQRDGVDQAARAREMQEKMKNMRPEQREQVEKMMRQHGISIEGGGKFKVCMSKESMDTDAWHQQSQREMSCTTQRSKSGNVWKWHSSCPAPHASESDGEATFVSDTQYTMKVVTTTTREGGEKTTRTMTGQSKWLGADCGDIKPVVPPRKTK